MKWYQRCLMSGIGFVIWLFISIVFKTNRVLVFGRDIETEYMKRHPGKGALYASWHRGLFFFTYFYRYLGFVVMLSASKDGDIGLTSLELFGWVPVRGSSSKRGSEALHEMQHYFDKGHRGGLVVDAPKGPAHRAKIGIIILAKRTGLPIFPVMLSAEKCWRLRNWDGSIIPKPFSRIVFLYADKLLYVPPDATEEECEQKRQELDRILNQMMYQTDHFFSQSDITDPRQIAVPETMDEWLAEQTFHSHKRENSRAFDK